MSLIQHFLLVFDHSRGELLDTVEFGQDAKRATEEYAKAEKQYRGSDMIEIVLVGADSLDTVRLTHANYFDGSAAISQYLIGL